MEAKDKAKALVKKFYVDAVVDFDAAKLCALILVEEIFETIDWHITDIPHDELFYWNEVQREIEKL